MLTWVIGITISRNRIHMSTVRTGAIALNVF